MEKNYKQLLESGVGALKHLVGSYDGVHNIAGRVGVERTLRHLDILITAYGSESYDEDFKTFKKDKGVLDYAVNQEYTKDKVYGAVKELEFLVECIRNEGGTRDYKTFENGIVNVLELMSEIFNKWEIYEVAFVDKVKVQEKQVEEFAYEELVESGETPKYTDDVNDESIEEKPENKPMTRVERRRKQRNR